MLIENRTARVALVILLILLVIPLVVMAGMMAFGGGMMAQMGGGMQMGSGFIALCALWAVLVAAALIFLIVLLTRGAEPSAPRPTTAARMGSPLPH